MKRAELAILNHAIYQRCVDLISSFLFCISFREMLSHVQFVVGFDYIQPLHGVRGFIVVDLLMVVGTKEDSVRSPRALPDSGDFFLLERCLSRQQCELALLLGSYRYHFPYLQKAHNDKWSSGPPHETIKA